MVCVYVEASLVAQLVKNPPAVLETPVQFLGQEDPLDALSRLGAELELRRSGSSLGPSQ